MPTIAATNKFPPALVARVTAPKQPRTIRAIRPRGAVRAGVFGSLSAISSTTASSVRTMRVTGRSKKANSVPAKCNQPRCAAQQTTAGGVSERSPVRQPRRKQKQRKSKVMTVAMHLSLAASTLIYQKSFNHFPRCHEADQHSRTPYAPGHAGGRHGVRRTRKLLFVIGLAIPFKAWVEGSRILPRSP